jgi:hypothetical protein
LHNPTACGYGSRLGGRDDERVASLLLHQRFLRRGQRQKILRVAADVRMRLLGGALVGPVDFRPRQATAKRQSQHFAVALLRRQRFWRDPAPAESAVVKRLQYVTHGAEAAARFILGAAVGIFQRGVAQARQRLRGRLAQLRVGTAGGYLRRQPLGRAIVERSGRPKPLDAEFLFDQLPVHAQS